GDWNIIHVLKSGDVAGELGFLDGEPRTATLRSLGTVRVLELKRANFETLLMEDPKLVYHVMRAIIRQVHSIVRRMNTHFVELHNYISHQHGRY
ncbi:MAG: cyclic nucleotide-binding domain-containing protein, partial [Ectothiorhodospiraceae bacterium]|nr:cyclic nucleotide-binding domain-containing protein [Ectothiorhodospiraceae bacterium]